MHFFMSVNWKNLTDMKCIQSVLIWRKYLIISDDSKCLPKSHGHPIATTLDSPESFEIPKKHKMQPETMVGSERGSGRERDGLSHMSHTYVCFHFKWFLWTLFILLTVEWFTRSVVYFHSHSFIRNREEWKKYGIFIQNEDV